MSTVQVCETFTSIQGESTFAGLSCFFIRLAGCNLDCTYCDTPLSKTDGDATTISDLATAWNSSNAQICEITGGEPLLQPAFTELAEALTADARPVLTETNGSRDISLIPAGVIAVMDVKTPGSGMADALDIANIGRLRTADEVKFVITDRADYEWAKEFTLTQKVHEKCNAVLFGPVAGQLEAKELAEWICNDGLPVRLQLQLHKILGVK